MKVPFNFPYLVGDEIKYLETVCAKGSLSGDGDFTRKCSFWLERNIGCKHALLTHSCTAALEMAAILANIGPGDEVIMPSYTFVSTANAFVVRGAVPVFVDIRADTLNIDESLIEEAITPRTKAIITVHYAGVACEMDSIMNIAKRHGLLVIEDAAQGLMGTYKGRALGSIGDLGCLSFHETKNIIAGEGGALLVNNSKFSARAEIIREKGTNRSVFLRGQVDKYTWVDIGSSFLPSELIAAFLFAQLEHAKSITTARRKVWQIYHEKFCTYEAQGIFRRPIVPHDCVDNAHMYYLLLEDADRRDEFIAAMNARGVGCAFHYVPLHSSPFGVGNSRVSSEMSVTDHLASCIVRLPLWPHMTPSQQKTVIDSVTGLLC